MPQFSQKSLDKLATCDPRLQKVMNEVIKHVDCVILEGHRGEETQNEYFEQGKSKTRFPDSKHNKLPSQAIDAVPYPIDWADGERIRAFAFFVKGVASVLGVRLRLGADWDGDFTNKDQTFNDLPHIELAE